MGTKFFYALILAGVGIAVRLVMFFTGFETEKLATGQYMNWVMLPVIIAIYWFALKAVRDERPHQAISYGQAVGAGALISLISSALSSVYNFIHLSFVNTSFADYQLALIREKWVQAGLSDTQMDQAEKMTRSMMGPIPSSLVMLVMGFVFGLVFVLILSAFVKRAAPEGAEPPPM